jgi:hypothetical protein
VRLAERFREDERLHEANREYLRLRHDALKGYPTLASSIVIWLGGGAASTLSNQW